jgi:hypothetical protein
MSFHRVFMLVFIITTIVCLVFLTYSASQYYDAFTFSRSISISVQDFRVEPEGSNMTVETVLTIRNAYKLELKASYVIQEIYRNSGYTDLLGTSSLTSWSSPSDGQYALVVPPFGTTNITLRTLLENFSSQSSNFTLFSIVYMGVEDIPIIKTMQVKEYFALSA